MLRRLAAAGIALALVGTGPAASADSIRDRQQPLMTTLELAAAWKLTQGRGVTVAVVDTGVAADNADLAGSVSTGPNQLADIDGTSTPLHEHGTAMASIIAGHGHGAGGAEGVIGIAPQARLVSVRSIAEQGDPSWKDYEDYGEDESVAGGIKYAVSQGVDVINLSLGGYGRDTETRRAVADAIQHGVVVVASVGNDGDKRGKADRSGFAPYSYPAGYPGVIGVAATGSDHRRAGFSNKNYSALVAAPGVDIATAWPDGGYRLVSGTSPAAAVTSGVVALIRSRHPKMAPSLVARALVAGVGHPAPGGYGPELGYGEIDAARALQQSDKLGGYTLTQNDPAAGKRIAGSAASPRPVAVVDHPQWFVVGTSVVAITGLAGLIVAAFLALNLYRRRSSDL